MSTFVGQRSYFEQSLILKEVLKEVAFLQSLHELHQTRPDFVVQSLKVD